MFLLSQCPGGVRGDDYSPISIILALLFQVLEMPIHVHRKYPRLSISGWAVDAKLFRGALKLYREFAEMV
jgi:hypothetical protein